MNGSFGAEVSGQGSEKPRPAGSLLDAGTEGGQAELLLQAFGEEHMHKYNLAESLPDFRNSASEITTDPSNPSARRGQTSVALDDTALEGRQ
jgi:hypothetical protein